MDEDKTKEEINELKRKRSEIKQDLANLGPKLSAVSSVVLLMHLAILDNDIRDMTKNLEDMGFEEFMRKAWGSDDKLR